MTILNQPDQARLDALTRYLAEMIVRYEGWLSRA